MKNKPGNYSRMPGVPGLFLPQKEAPEVKPLSPLPSLPLWAAPQVAPAPSIPASKDTPDLKRAIVVSKKPEQLWTRRAIAINVAILCIIVLSLWLTVRGVPNFAQNQDSDQNTRNYVSGGGIIFPNQELVISYPATERILAILVKPGDTVTPDQPLMQLDPSQLNSQTTQAYNDLVAAQTYLKSVATNGNALTVALAQQKYDFAKSKYQALVGQISSITLHKGSLVSPMRGVVTAITVNVGDLVSANTAIVTIMDESRVIVHTKIALTNIHQIKRGQVALVVPSSLPSAKITGIVSEIIPSADPQTDTFEVWVEIINTNHALLPGMSAFVRIQNTGTTH